MTKKYRVCLDFNCYLVEANSKKEAFTNFVLLIKEKVNVFLEK